MCSLASPCKAMQNDVEITLRYQFETRRAKFCESRDLDMSGPANASPGGQVLVSKAGFCFFLRNYSFPLFINKFMNSE